MLEKVTTGKVQRPLAAVIYGVEGVGKTTFGASFPNPVFVGAERTDNVDTARFPVCSSYDEFLSCVSALDSDQHTFKTLVVDTIDSIEPLLWDKIKKESNVTSIELAGGGYGKGYVQAQEHFLKLIGLFEQLRNRGINIVVLAHSQVHVFSDPVTNLQYDTYRMKLHKKAAPVFTEWCDLFLFANWHVMKVKTEDGRISSHGSGQRVLFTEKRPAFEAKNRFGLPFEMQLNAAELLQKIAAFYASDTKQVDTLQAEIVAKAKTLDEKTNRLVIETMNKAGNDINKLNQIAEKVRKL